MILFTWIALCSLAGAIGYSAGLRVIVPGPSSLAALKINAGERIAMEHDLPLCDGLLLVVESTSDILAEKNVAAINVLIKRLEALRITGSERPLFTLLRSSISPGTVDKDALVSSDRLKTLIIAQSASPVYQSQRDFGAIPDVLRDWSAHYPGIMVHYLSHATGESEVLSLIERDLDHSLIYTIPITLVILIWAFGSIIAALIPLAIAAMSLIASLGVSAVVSQYVDGISATSAQFVVLLVLAIGIDYSLFFITRAREELASGADLNLAILNTNKSAGVAIFWSGLIVSISLLGLMLMKDTVLNSMALVAVISVLITLASCLISLPACLALFLPSLKEKQAKERKLLLITQWSLRYPIISALILAIALSLLSLYSRSMNLGNTMIPDLLPSSLQGINTFQILKRDFPNIVGGDVSLIVYGAELEERESSGELLKAIEALNQAGLRGPFRTDTSDDFFVERHKFAIDGNGNEPETKLFIDRLRREVLPSLFSPLGLTAEVAGIIPYALNEAQRYSSRLPLIFGAVLCVSAIFLLFAFKSIVIPIKAIILNLLSTCASFGILVIVFQLIPSSTLYTGVIESFIPPLLFAILFGLSMDYHVFILARITEEFYRSGDTVNAVTLGIQETSRTITSAAMIMVSVFLVAATLELPVMRQLGIGLAAAVLIDATVIRTMLLPATMVLLGRWNWYLPLRKM